jgi:hypothetical protein
VVRARCGPGPAVELRARALVLAGGAAPAEVRRLPELSRPLLPVGGGHAVRWPRPADRVALVARLQVGLPAGAQVAVLPLELALDRARLAAALPAGARVAVVGNSHSGALVLEHLAALGARSHAP